MHLVNCDVSVTAVSCELAKKKINKKSTEKKTNVADTDQWICVRVCVCANVNIVKAGDN